MNKFNIIWVALVAVAIIAITGLLFPKTGEQIRTLAGMTNLDGLTISAADSGDGLIVGTTTGRTTTTKIISGTCNLTSISLGQIDATSTLVHWCNVTGVTTGDKVFGSPPTQALAAGSTTILAGPNMFGGLIFGAAGLASTSGRIAVPITNLTGAATGSYAGATTSYQYFIIR